LWYDFQPFTDLYLTLYEGLEMLAFAPLRISNDNDRIQPVWYRVVHIENGSVKWARYLDSYHPFPPRTGYDPKLFYRDLNALKTGWDKVLAPAMKIDIPDERIANMARYSLIREMMTRVQDFPRYGAVDKNYGGSEHDGFPDTFTVDTTAMLEWGLIDTAGRYIDNYFGKFVRDDGSILYRGPETGQYGRMLTVVAQYINDGGDPRLVLKHRTRIDGVAKLLLPHRLVVSPLAVPHAPVAGKVLAKGVEQATPGEAVTHQGPGDDGAEHGIDGRRKQRREKAQTQRGKRARSGDHFPKAGNPQRRRFEHEGA